MAAAVNPYFGRAFKIVVTTQAGETVTISNSSTGSPALKVRFSTDVRVGIAWDEAEVEVINLSDATKQYLISQGDEIAIFAGYQSTFHADVIQQVGPGQGGTGQSGGNNSSLIWEGKIFQATWERVGVTDLVTTFRCVTFFFQELTNAISFAIGANATQAEIVQRIADGANIPIEQIDSDRLSQKKMPRGKTFFGTPGQFLSQIASDNGLSFWLSKNGINVRSTLPTTQEPDFLYGPPIPPGTTVHPDSTLDYTPTLIGTPQQTQEGVIFTVLMDSRPKIGSLVKLSMAVIRRLKVKYGRGNEHLSNLDQDGIFAVIGVRHTGNTRGNEWYTELTCVSRSFFNDKGLLKYLAIGG